MISSNVDLTENRDFSAGRFQGLMDIELDRALMQDVQSIEHDSMISMDMYRNISTKENIFGRTRHYTESLDVFRKSESAWVEEMRTHCQRCGKELRIPWKRNMDVCKECNSILERDYMGSVFPWKRTGEGITWSSKDNTMDIFHMR